MEKEIENNLTSSKGNNWYETIIKYLCIVSLMFSFTNIIYASAVSVLAVVFFIPLLFKNGLKVNKLAFSILILILFYLISAAIVQPMQVINFSFYRRDGNFFITFIPLLILSMCRIKFDMEKIIKYFVLISSFANVITLAVFLIKRPQKEYFMLFTAHNAAGGFLAMLSIVNLFYIIRHPKRYVYFLTLLTNLAGLYFTNSRGSLLPFIIALVVFLLMKLNKKIDIWIFLITFLISLVFIGIIANVRGETSLTEFSSGSIPEEYYKNKFYTALFSLFDRSWTLIDRLFYLWPRAVYLFFKSPLFGVGFGSFNDVDYSLFGINGVFMLNIGAQMANDSAHAHNTYFHLLAETGLFGFVLFLVFVYYIRKFILSERDANVKNCLLVMLLYAVFSSFFEHRFYTPAQMIPFVLLLGMSISNTRAEKINR